MSAGACIDGRYRYRLWREWGPHAHRVAFVMLNPSTADAEQDDPTIRRCIGFARRWHMDALDVVNLFAYRASDPADLRRAGYPIGDENDDHIVEVCSSADLIVAAWGAHAPIERADAVRERLRQCGFLLRCLGMTKDGQPRHPLMLSYATELARWPSE